MSLYFGTDNPYRAPNVAKDVVTWQGVKQEQVYAPVVKSDAMDFFYQGVESFKNGFSLIKGHYEDQANKAMAEAEEAKAQDILNGLSQEQVNINHQDRYNAIADSGVVNKNLDARKTFTRNMLAAHGAVTGDVAQKQYDLMLKELAEKGHSYVESQEILERFQRRWEDTPQVAQLLKPEIDKRLNAARTAERQYEMNSALTEMIEGARADIFAPESMEKGAIQASWVELRGDPNNPVLLTEDDGSVSLQAIEHTGKHFYDTHYKKHVEGLPPEQQAYAQKVLGDLATEDARKWTEQVRLAQLEDRRIRENASTISGALGVIATSDADINAAIPTEEVANGMTAQRYRQTQLVNAADAISRGNHPNKLDFVWNPENRNGMFGSLASRTQNVQEMRNLVKAFPPKDVEIARQLGYAFTEESGGIEETQEQWEARRDQMLREIAPLLIDEASTLARHQGQNIMGQWASTLNDLDPAVRASGAQQAEQSVNSLRTQLIKLGDELTETPGATEAALGDVFNSNLPKSMVPLITAIRANEGLFDTARKNATKRTGGNLKKGTVEAMASDDLIAFGGQLSEQTQAAIAQFESSEDPNDRITISAAAVNNEVNDLGLAIVNGNPTFYSTIYRINALQNSEANAHLPKSWTASFDTLTSGAWQASQQSSDPVQRRAGQGHMHGAIVNDVLTFSDGSRASETLSLRLKEEVGDMENTEAFEWTREPGNIEYATTLVNEVIRGAGGDRELALNRLRSVYGEEASTLWMGYNFGIQGGFGAQANNTYGGTFKVGPDQQEVSTDETYSVISLIDPDSEGRLHFETMRKSVQSLASAVPETFDQGGLVTGAAQNIADSIRAIEKGNTDEGIFGSEQASEFFFDSNILDSDPYGETAARADGLGRISSESVRRYMREKFDAVVANPAAEADFNFLIQQELGNFPFPEAGDGTWVPNWLPFHENPPTNTEAYLKQVYDAALKKFDAKWGYDGTEIIPREGNEQRLSNARAMRSLNPASVFGAFDGVDQSGFDRNQNAAYRVAHGDLSAWVGNLAEEDRTELVSQFWAPKGPDGQPRPGWNPENGLLDGAAGELQEAMAYTYEFLADWTMPDGTPVLDRVIRDENGTVSDRFVRHVSRFVDGRGVHSEQYNQSIDDVLPWNGVASNGAHEYSYGIMTQGFMYGMAEMVREAQENGEELPADLVDLLPTDSTVDFPAMATMMNGEEMALYPSTNSPTGLYWKLGDVTIPVNLPADETGRTNWPSVGTNWFSRETWTEEQAARRLEQMHVNAKALERRIDEGFIPREGINYTQELPPRDYQPGFWGTFDRFRDNYNDWAYERMDRLWFSIWGDDSEGTFQSYAPIRPTPKNLDWTPEKGWHQKGE